MRGPERNTGYVPYETFAEPVYYGRRDFGLLFFGTQLISLYLHEAGESGDLEATLLYARKYLRVMLVELAPFAVIGVFGYLAGNGETMLPMKAGIAAVFVNLVLNYILIFGKLGIPALGVEGPLSRLPYPGSWNWLSWQDGRTVRKKGTALLLGFTEA